MEDDRHVQSRIVDKEAVGLFSVLAEAFAMIAAEHDQRVPV